MSTVVTMVFTDLVNSTAIKGHLPGGDITARNHAYIDTILTPHRRRVEERLEEFGGRVVKTEGDAYFLVFANAGKAVQWAVGVETNHINDPIPTPLGDLQMKVGMHTGSPIPDGDDFVGHEVDYAARVSALANGGQILLSEATTALVRTAHIADVSFHSHGDRELKGIGRVPIYELLYGEKQAMPLKEAVLSPTNLPPPPHNLIGRSDLLADLRERMENGGVTILKGQGGMGKTTLALTAAHGAHAAGELPGGVAWLNCELEPARDECLRELAFVFFGDRMEQENIDRCYTRVMEHWRNTGALAVFDNFETVAQDTGILRWLAGVRAPARVVVTTREAPMGLRGRVIEVNELTRDEAVKLFLEEAIDRGLDAAGQEDQVNKLCAAVGNHPLAIELLAARSTRLPLSRLLERVQRDLGILDAKGDPTRPHRHQSARACFALTYEQLTEQARSLLQGLSVLADGAGADVISAVMGTDDWDEAAEELVSASVWRLTGERYKSHPQVRQYALEQLPDRASSECEVAKALTRTVSERGEQTKPGATTPAVMVGALDWIETEWNNILACADFAMASKDWETVAQLSDAVSNFFIVRGHWGDCDPLYRSALTARRNMGDRAGEAKTIHNLSIIFRRQGRWAEAEAACEQSVRMTREIGDRAGEAESLGDLAWVYQLQGRLTEAETACRQSMEICREIGDIIGEGKTLNNLGIVCRSLGKLDEAETAHLESLALSRRAGDRVGEGQTLNYLAWVYQLQNRLDEAERVCQESLAIRREIGHRRGVGWTLNNLGNILRLQKRWQHAYDVFKQSLLIWIKYGDLVNHGDTLKNMALLRADQGDLRGALALGKEAIGVLETTEDVQVLKETRDLVSRWEETLAGVPPADVAV